MSAQHTPGPWFNTSQGDTPVGEVMDRPLDSGVTLHISVSGPNAKADARLIATAPELLEALKDAILWIVALSTSDNSCEPAADVGDLEAVIAKATGSAA